MSEYIEKSALLEAIKAVKPDMTMNLGAGAYMTPHEAAWDMYNDIKNVIEGATAADVAPVVQGRWIEELGNVLSCRCSVCDHTYKIYEDDINGYPYCAWCGAKMDEREGK